MMGRTEVDLTVSTRITKDGRAASTVESSVRDDESAEVARFAGEKAAELSRRIVEHDLRTLRSLPRKNG